MKTRAQIQAVLFCCVQASQILSHQTGKTMSLWSWLCGRGLCHVETGKRQTHTVASGVIYHYAAALRFLFSVTVHKGPDVKV